MKSITKLKHLIMVTSLVLPLVEPVLPGVTAQETTLQSETSIVLEESTFSGALSETSLDTTSDMTSLESQNATDTQVTTTVLTETTNQPPSSPEPRAMMANAGSGITNYEVFPTITTTSTPIQIIGNGDVMQFSTTYKVNLDINFPDSQTIQKVIH